MDKFRCGDSPVMRFMIAVINVLFVVSAFSQEERIDGGYNNEEMVKMSVFEVSDSSYDGYVASKTLSGAKMAMDVSDVPQTINIVTRDLIDDLGAFDPGTTIAKIAPGTTVFADPSPARGMMIRGFRAQNWSINGATIRNLGMVTNFNLEALEVVKGPSALLFGPFGAYGGYVNMVPKMAGTNSKNKLQASVGTDNYYSAMLDYGGQLEGLDNIHYRLVMGYLDRDRPGYDFDYNKNWTIAPSISIGLSGRSQLDMRLEVNHVDKKWSRGVLDVNGDFIRGFSSMGPLSENTEYSDNWTFQSLYTSEISDAWAMKFNFLYQSESHYFSSGYLNGRLPSATYQYILNKRKMTQHNLYADLSTTWSLNDLPHGMDNKFLVSLNINHWNNPWSFDARSQLYPEYAGLQMDPLDPDWDMVRSISLDWADRVIHYNRELLGGIVALNTLSMMDDRLKLLAGARYNYDERSNHIQSRSGRGEPLTGSPAPMSVNEKITLKYGVVYDITKQFSVYYGHDESYLPVGSGALFYDGSEAKPETGLSDEVGLKFDKFEILGGQISGSISYFQLEVANKTRQDPNHPRYWVQDGLQVNNGVDFQVTYTNEKFSAIVGMYKGDGPIEEVPDTGLRGVGAPRLTYNMWGKYSITEKMAVGGGYHWVDSVLSNDRTRETDAFGSADLFFSYTTAMNRGVMNYRLGVSNLFDVEAVTSIFQAAQVTTEDARSIKLTMSYSW